MRSGESSVGIRIKEGGNVVEGTANDLLEALKSSYYVTSDKRVAPENRHWLPLRPFPFPLPLPRLPEAAPPLPFP